MKRRERILFILIGLVWAVGNILIFQITQTHLPLQVNEIWEQTVINDANRRLTETGKRYIRKYDNNETSSKISKVTIETEHEKTSLDTKDIPNPKDEADRDNRALQTILLYFKPVNTNKLDSLFQISLSDEHIFAPTAVSYLYNKADSLRQYSTTDTLFYQNSFATDTIKTGIDNSIILNGYVKLSWTNNLLYASPVYILWMFISIICAFVIHYYIRKRSIKNPINKTLANNDIEAKIEQPYIPTCKTIIYKVSHRELIYEDITASLAPLQAALLDSLLEDKNYYQDYNSLINKLWPNDSGEKKRLEQQRYILEERLQAIPSIHIRTIPRSGYQLVLDENVVIRREE